MALTYEVLGTTTLGSNTQFITFSSIPQTYTDLILHLKARGTRAGFVYQDVLGTLSGFSDSMFGQYIGGQGGTMGAGNITDRFWFVVPAAGNAATNYWSVNELYLYSYSNAITPATSGTPKMLQIEEGYSGTSTATSATNAILRSLIFTRNDAVTSITFGTQTDAFLAGTYCVLYGIKRA